MTESVVFLEMVENRMSFSGKRYASKRKAAPSQHVHLSFLRCCFQNPRQPGPADTYVPVFVGACAVTLPGSLDLAPVQMKISLAKNDSVRA